MEKPARATLKITRRGAATLQGAPSRIDMAYLSRFPEFAAFRARTREKPDDGEEVDVPEPEPTETPEERLQRAVIELRTLLAAELIAKLKESSPRRFETVCLEVLAKLGYGEYRPEAAKHTGQSHDGGIDGVIDEDRLGLEKVYLQAKKYDDLVPIQKVREFVGSVNLAGGRKGVMITTGRFPGGADEVVRKGNIKIVLIDGLRLAELMIDHDVGVSATQAHVVKKLDSDYFDED